jgi:hypothetical protein
MSCGFNEKVFTFFMEDNYLTVNDSIKLYNTKNRVINSLNDTKERKELHAAIFKTINNFRFINKLEHYDTFIKLHLVKLPHQNGDVKGIKLC